MASVAQELQGRSNGDLYMACLYWSFSTMTTVGYGDVSSDSNPGRLISIVGMCFGITAFTYAMSAMLALAKAMFSEDANIVKHRVVRFTSGLCALQGCSQELLGTCASIDQQLFVTTCVCTDTVSWCCLILIAHNSNAAPEPIRGRCPDAPLTTVTTRMAGSAQFLPCKVSDINRHRLLEVSDCCAADPRIVHEEQQAAKSDAESSPDVLLPCLVQPQPRSQYHRSSLVHPAVLNLAPSVPGTRA